MSKEELLSKKVWVPALVALIVGLSTFCWNQNARLSAIESKKDEIIRLDARLKACWEKYGDVALKYEVLIVEVGKNSKAIELLH